MNSKDKKRFITNLCNSVKLELISKIGKMPENWDGIELRELICDKFKNETYLGNDKKSKRFKDYQNEVLIKNL